MVDGNNTAKFVPISSHLVTALAIVKHGGVITIQKIWKTGGVGVVARGAGEVAAGIEGVGALPDRMPGNPGKSGNHVGLRGDVIVAGNTEVRGIEAKEIVLI